MVAMRRALLALAALAGLALAAALSTGAAAAPDRAPSAREGAPPLARFASCRGFLAYVRREARVVTRAGGGPPVRALAPATPEGGRAAVTAPAAGVDFSDTNVQEAGVDEPDLVETDGRTVYAVAGDAVEVVDASGAAPRRIARLTLDGVSPTGLLLVGGRLIVLGDAGLAVPAAAPAARLNTVVAGPIGPQRTVLAQVDVTDPARPRVLARMTVDGRLVAARRTGGTVRAVVATTAGPVELGRARALRAGAGAWLPRLTLREAGSRRATRRAAVGCRAVSRPKSFSGLGMVTVLTVDAAGPLALLDSDAILTDGDTVYASPTSMYVATSALARPGPGRDGRARRGGRP